MKSFVGFQVAQSIATGHDILGHKTREGKVLYIDFELGDAEGKSRYLPLEKALGESRNFMLRTRDAEKLSLDETGPGFRNLWRFVDKLREDGNKPDVIFFDTLRMSHSHLESDSTDMMKVYNKLRELKTEFDLSAFLIHHDGKADEKGKTSSRGSSVIEDVPESLGHLSCSGCHNGTVNAKPAEVTIEWTLRNHAPVPPSTMQFDASIGLFIPKPSKPKPDPDSVGNKAGVKVTALADKAAVELQPETEISRQDREKEDRKAANRNLIAEKLRTKQGVSA